jgi:phage terminase large subunit-like protein
VKPKQIASIEDLFNLAKTELRNSVDRGNVFTYQGYPKQELFHRSAKPGRYVAGANRSGKTDAEVVEMIYWATNTHPFLERPERWGNGPLQLRCVVVDIVKGVESIILPKLKRWTATSMLIDGEWDKSWDQRTLTFTFSNGSTIQFLTHAMELDKHGGVPLHAVFFDEEPPQSVFNENMMRLIDYDGFWVIAATPVLGMGWTYDLLWEPAEAGAIEYIDIFQFKQEDNPYLQAGKEARSKFYVAMNDEERAIREEGAFIARSGLVFPQFSTKTHVLEEPWQIDREWKWYASVDFGWNNPTAWLWHASAPDGRIVTFAEHYAGNKTTSEHAAIVNAREQGWHRIPDVRVGDPAGNQHQMNSGTSAIAEYARLGIFIGTEVPKDVMVGVEKLQQYFRVEEEGPWGQGKARWMISPNCVNLIRELKRLRWAAYESQKKQYELNRQEVIHKKDDHAFDSIRYLASMMPDLRPEPTVVFDGRPITLTFEQVMETYAESPPVVRDREVWDTEDIDTFEGIY